MTQTFTAADTTIQRKKAATWVKQQATNGYKVTGRSRNGNRFEIIMTK